MASLPVYKVMSSRSASTMADNVQGLVAIEWRDLHGDDPRDLGEAAPERVAQGTAAHRRLQVKP
jgi:hypothetical protein